MDEQQTKQYILSLDVAKSPVVSSSIEMEGLKYQHRGNSGEYDNGADMYAINQEIAFNLVSHKYLADDPNNKCFKLLNAVAKFGDAGCSSKEANLEAFPNVQYNSDGNLFMNLGLFLELVFGSLPPLHPQRYIIVDPTHCLHIPPHLNKDPYIAITRLSRNAKSKYRLTQQAKSLLAEVNKNKKFYSIYNIVKEMMKDEVCPEHCILIHAIKCDPIDMAKVRSDFEELSNDGTMLSRFKKQIDTLGKSLKKIAA